MVPFRVFDRSKKQVWQVINYHPSSDSYLASYDGEEPEDDSGNEGQMRLITSSEMVNLTFVDFLEEVDSYDE